MPPEPARRRCRTFASRSPSRRSPARSGGRRAAGSKRRTRTSSTSTRRPGAVTSPPGRSWRSSRTSYVQRSGRCAEGGPMSTTVETATGIRSFQVEIPDEQIEDLRRRIESTRWPTKELVSDSSQGIELALLEELARYWAHEYDFGRLESRLNAVPQFTTEIDSLDIHFIHVKSAHDNALPVIITHGWPGSIIEMLGVIEPLTDPTAHGGEARDAFDVVIPSIPGYGFSDEPTEPGWDSGRIGAAWAELMSRLGYTRYVAQGGDQGAGVTDAMGRQAPDGLL